MDWSWLGDLFVNFLHLFNPLKSISHWKIWAQIWDLYKRVKGWEDWYKKHVLAQIQAEQKLMRQIFNTWIRPVLSIIDTIRRLAGVVAIFNRALASRLNLLFTRIEGYLLKPFNAVTSRLDTIQRIFDAFLTPLGYLDRATLLNSIWRDFGLLRSLWHNPFGATITAGAGGPVPTFPEQVADVASYLEGKDSPIKASVDPLYSSMIELLGGQQ